MIYVNFVFLLNIYEKQDADDVLYKQRNENFISSVMATGNFIEYLYLYAGHVAKLGALNLNDLQKYNSFFLLNTEKQRVVNLHDLLLLYRTEKRSTFSIQFVQSGTA